ncbi:MAG: KH domain-containing protein [Eubacterium sp.]
MTELVETIAKALVDDPERVVVTEESDRQGEVLQLQVAGSDMGKVIGKKGRIARALRTVVKAAATKENKKVTVEIVSEDELDQTAE